MDESRCFPLVICNMVYLKLVRWKNLLIIICTQILIKFFIIDPVLEINGIDEQLSIAMFGLLSLSTVLIAGAGYIINDIFDVNIDEVNKPADKMVGKQISLVRAQRFYWLLNISGIIAGFIAGILLDYVNFVFIYILSSLLLWFYSSAFKKMPLIGNLAIAFLSGISFYLLWIAELLNEGILFTPYYDPPIMGTALVIGYTAFAFVINLLREIVKDIEDLEGDKTYGCRTLPVVYGVKVTRRVALLIATVVFLMTLVSQYFMSIAEWYLMFGYFVLLIQVPLVFLIVMLVRAKTKKQFDYVSKFTKLVMITGVGSILMAYYSMV